MLYTTRPLDASTWDAFAELVERNNGIFGGCWCMGYHPDYRGKKPTHELIERLHRQHQEQQAALHSKLEEIYDRLDPGRGEAPGQVVPGQAADGVTTPPRREEQAAP